ncbi:hypothetical protein H5392_13680 [Tessaracoccus sp. MC1865]|uniref:Uncharacterized protein n=1 Tax=Tessaracoccus bendigoensis DSM 12906 TaxID=1123357 RepID=A0A1M6JHN6_9ACTN|nr:MULTISPECIES: hypothetical protein [Tessaracoccus]MBB1484908.1 hypothetical protein [Tessaracoccus sp. MC1865]MDO5676371.1 hypothetical protein [Propionibacteriaceae bacterium]QTO38653.1 hypothetical protein J7D54_06170 [Tessaracoccus sp. MC1865]SHJ46181.1 hypothetical protein SAMN02745244_02566 [Tessaracoccus bendigoensis DSM 12906]
MDQLKSIITLLSTFVSVAGGLWLAWGVISLGFAIKEQEGSGMRGGILQIVGGGLVLAGGVYLGTLGG